MTRSVSARASIGGVIVLVAAACGSATAVPSSSPAAASSPVPPTTEAPQSREPSTGPQASAGPTTFDTTELGTWFDLPMTLELPEHWMPLTRAQTAVQTFSVVHAGDPPSDESQWWGFGGDLVDGAWVNDPSVVTSPDSGGNIKLPWPASYVDYLVEIPGVELVSGPEPVTVAGTTGRKVTVITPPMHPTIYTNGDFAWLGGGKSGIDPAFERQLIELTLNGKKLLIEYVDDPAKFDSRVAEVNSIIASIKTKD